VQFIWEHPPESSSFEVVLTMPDTVKLTLNNPPAIGVPVKVPVSQNGVENDAPRRLGK